MEQQGEVTMNHAVFGEVTLGRKLGSGGISNIYEVHENSEARCVVPTLVCKETANVISEGSDFLNALLYTDTLEYIDHVDLGGGRAMYTINPIEDTDVLASHVGHVNDIIKNLNPKNIDGTEKNIYYALIESLVNQYISIHARLSFADNPEESVFSIEAQSVSVFIDNTIPGAIVRQLIPRHGDGRNLRRFIDETEGAYVDFDEIYEQLQNLRPVVSALECIHGIGLVDRDVKPENILLVDGSTSRLVDFGLAKFAGKLAVNLGSPAYMSPEQANGESTKHLDRIDKKSDIYQFAMVVFELLTNRRSRLSYGDSVEATNASAFFNGLNPNMHCILNNLFSSYKLDHTNPGSFTKQSIKYTPSDGGHLVKSANLVDSEKYIPDPNRSYDLNADSDQVAVMTAWFALALDRKKDNRPESVKEFYDNLMEMIDSIVENNDNYVAFEKVEKYIFEKTGSDPVEYLEQLKLL